MVDGGVLGGTRVDFPAKATAEVFARLLERRGIEVINTPIETKVPSPSDPVASVRSATVAQIVEAMIAQSDNEAAEILLRQAAVAAGRPGTFDGGVATVRTCFAGWASTRPGSSCTTAAGSPAGTASHRRRSPRSSPSRRARPGPTAWSPTWPSAASPGRWPRRFGKADAGRGVVRGKSGTLTGVHSLAGYVTDRSGTPIAFAVMIDRTKSINPFVTEAALDRVAAALADCRCSSPVP